MDTGAPAVDAVGLSAWFGEVTALDGVDLVVHSGQVHGLVGANGAGKSTLLSMVFGLMLPHEGTVRLFGRSRAEAGPAWLAGTAGFVEAPAFYPYLSGRRNLALLARLDGTAGTGGEVDDLLALVGLRDAADRRVRGYSLGMRQRLGLAAALLRRPRLLVLDEPTNGMDPAGIRDLRTTVRRLAGEGVAVLLSSHDMVQVSDLCDVATVLDRGRVVFTGPLDRARELAPDPSWRLATSDDPAAVRLAEQLPGVQVDRAPEGGLLVAAARPRLDAYVVELGRTGIAVRELVADVTALEALLFQLTGRSL